MHRVYFVTERSRQSFCFLVASIITDIYFKVQHFRKYPLLHLGCHICPDTVVSSIQEQHFPISNTEIQLTHYYHWGS